jgi:hypothetical protein
MPSKTLTEAVARTIYEAQGNGPWEKAAALVQRKFRTSSEAAINLIFASVENAIRSTDSIDHAVARRKFGMTSADLDEYRTILDRAIDRVRRVAGDDASARGLNG